MNKEELKTIILDQEQNKGNKNIVKRDVLSYLEKNMSNKLIIIITGLRRSGKSIIINELKKKYDGQYLNFDDYKLTNFNLNDFEKLEEVFTEINEKNEIFYFDEIQNVKSWERFIRTLHDKNKKIIITGSNASMLSSELGTHLTGRNITVKNYPFSFKEFLKFKKFQYNKNDIYVTTIKVQIKKLFDEYIKKGGIPEYLKNENPNYIQSIFDDIIFRDVATRYSITNTKTLKDLILYLTSNIAKEFSYSKLKGILGIKNTTTVKNYVEYFENSYLLFTINKYDYSLKKQLLNPKKVYLIDTGMINNISFKFSEDIGRLLENIVFIELKRRGKEIYYHRIKAECDFVIKQGLDIVEAIQVTKSLDDIETKKREIKGLLEACKTHNLKKGLILTQDEQGEEVIDNIKIKIMPIWKWLLGK